MPPVFWSVWLATTATTTCTSIWRGESVVWDFFVLNITNWISQETDMMSNYFSKFIDDKGHKLLNSKSKWRVSVIPK